MENIEIVNQPLSAEPSWSAPEALQAPTQRVGYGFMFALAAAVTSLFIIYTGVGTLLLPFQIGQLAPGSKIAILSIFTSVGTLIALVVNPLAGAFSDRTTSRFGRRRPWILVGSLLTLLGLFLMWQAKTLPLLFIGYCLIELFSSFALAPLTATIPDHVPASQRGTVSGIYNLALGLGSILGAVIAGQLFKNAPTNAYIALLVILFVATSPFALFLSDKALPKGSVPPFHLGAFLKGFWVSPRKYPDFGWAWLTRFIPFVGYFLGITYTFYYLQDVVKYANPLQGASTVTITIAVVG